MAGVVLLLARDVTNLACQTASLQWALGQAGVPAAVMERQCKGACWAGIRKERSGYARLAWSLVDCYQVFTNMKLVNDSRRGTSHESSLSTRSVCTLCVFLILSVSLHPLSHWSARMAWFLWFVCYLPVYVVRRTLINAFFYNGDGNHSLGFDTLFEGQDSSPVPILGIFLYWLAVTGVVRFQPQ